MSKKQSKNKARQNNQRKSKGRKTFSRRGNSKNKKNRTKLSYRKRPAKGGGNYVQLQVFWKQLKNKDYQDQWIEHINEFDPSDKREHIKLFFEDYLNSALKKYRYNLVDLGGIKQTIEKIIEKIEGVSDDRELKYILDKASEKINRNIQGIEKGIVESQKRQQWNEAVGREAKGTAHHPPRKYAPPERKKEHLNRNDARALEAEARAASGDVYGYKGSYGKWLP
jgi:hypothetical protein